MKNEALAQTPSIGGRSAPPRRGDEPERCRSVGPANRSLDYSVPHAVADAGPSPVDAERLSIRQRAVQRWENEGGSPAL